MGFNYLWCFDKTEKELMELLPGILATYKYKKIETGKEFIYAQGTIPILICAHIDTVFSKRRERPEIYYDSKKQVIWSPDGLGGDDRAGVSLILELIHRGHRPHVLFLDGEESGGTGARELVKTKKTTSDTRYIIEFDRKNGTEAVFYNCDNKKFVKYITGFGFKEATGSFSDISTICPAWGIAGVNLSCGYYNPHSKEEYVKLSEWRNVVEIVDKMLQSPPKKQFKYISKFQGYNKGAGYGEWGHGRGYSYVYGYNDDWADADWDNKHGQTYKTTYVKDDDGLPMYWCAYRKKAVTFSDLFLTDQRKWETDYQKEKAKLEKSKSNSKEKDKKEDKKETTALAVIRNKQPSRCPITTAEKKAKGEVVLFDVEEKDEPKKEIITNVSIAITQLVDEETLQTFHGGKKEDWTMWLFIHEDYLRNKLENEALDLVEQMIYANPPKFLTNNM